MTRVGRIAVGATALVAAAVLAGCSAPGTLAAGGPPPSGSGGTTTTTPGPVTPTGPAPSSAAASAAASATASDLPPVTDPVSLPALMRDAVVGADLRLGKVLARVGSYTRYAVSYRSDALTITGVMNVPSGKGPFPVVVLLHGHIDEDVYVTGQGFRREQDSLARNGYVAFHIDYRNYAGSDDDPDNDVDLRLGYARDAIAAVEALKASRLGFLDRQRIGLIGRSMGGGVAFNVLVARPGLVDAAVTYASVSTDAVDNYDRWIRFADGRRERARAIEARHGSPEADPAFWRGISSRTYFDRITTPLLMHQGVVDDTCPVAWARETVAALKAADVDVAYYEYANENH